MDNELHKLISRVIETELGEIISKELEIRFKPILNQMDMMQKSNDQISEQIKDDRQDIDQIRIDMAKSITQNKVIIENQNTQEDKIVEVVKEAANKIPHNVEESVEKMMEKKSWLKRFMEKFKKK
jgi:hypothetical protein